VVTIVGHEVNKEGIPLTQSRCLFVLPSMRAGGAERVVSLLLRHLDPQQFDLHLALAQSEGPYLDHIPNHVTLHNLCAERVSRSLLPLVKTVRQLKPDVVMSSLSHMNVVTALVRPTWPRNTRLVLRETATCDQILRTRHWGRLRSAVFSQQYRRADSIICQSEFMRDDLRRTFALPTESMVVIPNPTDFAAIGTAIGNAESPFPPGGPNIVALGRLAQVKNQRQLLQAIPSLLDKHPSANVWLLGDGPLKPSLMEMRRNLGIESNVHFAGFQANPFPWLKHADLFVLCSLSESCPNALLEAVACGCPTVSTMHPGGTREVHERLGISHRMVDRLDEWSDDWFVRPGREIWERAESIFAASNVTQLYASVFLGDCDSVAVSLKRAG
jgi:glycosyltransferase involved in cell wall biosynthesis